MKYTAAKKRVNTFFKYLTKKNKKTEEGWTFIETLVVIGIVMILTSSVGFMAFKYLDRAKIVTAKSQIEIFTMSLNSYLLDCSSYPTQEQGLEALWEKPVLEPVPSGWNGPYLNKNVPKDPWGREYKYSVPGPNNLPFSIISYGNDGNEGGEGNDKDITSWES